ncbi:DUF1217 domain-containing protein [Rhodovulum sp. YNF3179]|uniref:DUF1217 domain-containing protein n=1 Tax=Rhodovulum sp. YNF3179 TaxID=3425127 RepID=UPI003D33FECA
MSFQPVLPLGGLAGLRFLDRTLDRQSAAFVQAPEIQRNTDHFRARIGQIDTAAALVSDRRVLEVALGAFGLQDDLGNRFFIRKVLEEGTLSADALANRLADPRYAEFARAFGFGDFATPRTQLSDFADDIVARYETRSFEVAVGRQDESLRLALEARRALGEIAGSDATERTKWFQVLGAPPLRKVFETAFGLPAAFATLDIDRQADEMQARAARAFGGDSIGQFSDPDRVEALVRRFLAQAQLAAGPPASAPGMAALSLLQSTGSARSILEALY